MPLPKKYVNLENTTWSNSFVDQTNDPAVLRHGPSEPLLSNADLFADLFADQRAGFSINRNMSSYGAYLGDGNQYSLAVGAYVEPESEAPNYAPSPAGTFSTQKAAAIVSIRTCRESNSTSPFNDAVGLQVNANIVSGNTKGRVYGYHANTTIEGGVGSPGESAYRPAADGQAIGMEIELNQIGGSAQANLFAADQKTLLQLVPIGKMATKGIMFGTNTGGSYHTLMYVEAASVVDSFFRVGDAWSMKNVGGQVVTGIGTSSPRQSSDVAFHVVKPSQAYSIHEVAPGTGQAFMDFVVSGQAARSVGVDAASREFRITAQEGLGASIIASAQLDRWAFFGQPTVDGGSNIVFIKNGQAPTAVSDGGAIFVENGALKYKGGAGTVTTLAPA